MNAWVSYAEVTPEEWKARKAGAPPELLELARQGREMTAGARHREHQRQIERLADARKRVLDAIAVALRGAEWLGAFASSDIATFSLELSTWRVRFDLSDVGYQPVDLRLYKVPSPEHPDGLWKTMPSPWSVHTPTGELSFLLLSEALAAAEDLCSAF